VGVPFLSEEGTSSGQPEQTEQPGQFRQDLMSEIMEDHPGLTREKLKQQMEAMGF
jgi:hypothetical protein